MEHHTPAVIHSRIQLWHCRAFLVCTAVVILAPLCTDDDGVCELHAANGHRRYSAGAVLQILLFGVMAIQIKRKAPTAHTILEVVRLRWGKAAHIVSAPFHLLLLNDQYGRLPSSAGSTWVVHAHRLHAARLVSVLLLPAGCVHTECMHKTVAAVRVSMMIACAGFHVPVPGK